MKQMQKLLSILLAVTMICSISLSAFGAAANVGSITVIVEDENGDGLRNVPLVIDHKSVYRTDKNGKLLLKKKKAFIKMPSLFKGNNGKIYSFPLREWSLAAGETQVFRAESSRLALDESVSAGLYRVVKQAAAAQKDFASYWVDPPVGQREMERIVEKAIDRVRRDCPEYYLSNLTEVAYYSFSGENEFDLAEYKLRYSLTQEAEKEKVRNEIERIYQTVPNAATGQEIVRIFHDAIIERCDYDDKAAKSDSLHYPSAFNAHGVFVKGKAVCEGYACAFKMLCDRAGIPCSIVTGDLDGVAHAWNTVELDGKKHKIDCTTDDVALEEEALARN